MSVATMEKNRLTRVGLGVLIMALLLALAFLLLNILYTVNAPTNAAPRGRMQLWRAQDSGMTLEESMQQAEVRARGWADDIVLVRAEAPWRPGAAGRDVDTPPVTWSFYYYSPTMRELVAVVGPRATVLGAAAGDQLHAQVHPGAAAIRGRGRLAFVPRRRWGSVLTSASRSNGEFAPAPLRTRGHRLERGRIRWKRLSRGVDRRRIRRSPARFQITRNPGEGFGQARG